MKDVAYSDADRDPVKFIAYLHERLSEIPGTTWKSDPLPWHTSYEDWHMVGSIMLPDGLLKEKDKTVLGSPGGLARERRAVERTYPICARVSTHSLRLERQYQLNQTFLDERDPFGERHIRTLQLVKLPARVEGDYSLTAILMDFPEKNVFRDIVNFGPNWYTCMATPAVKKWDPTRTSSDEHRFPNISLNEFLEFATEACECCEMIHQGNTFVHGEIRTDAFCYFREKREVKLLNYGSGVRAFEHGLTSAGWSTLSKEYGVEHKLQFVAPEQTGRLQAAPDSRTDLYSLGIVFYNMLTGELPFDGHTPLEIMQNVLARPTPSISDKRPDIPESVAAVIKKMTSKSIENRYHSASGIKWDLRQIQKFLREGDCKALLDFKIAGHDFNSCFVLPNGLVGREEERQVMLSIIERGAEQLQKALFSSTKDQSMTRQGSSASDSRRGSVVQTEDFNTESDLGSLHTQNRLFNGIHNLPIPNGRDSSSHVPASEEADTLDESAVEDISGSRLKIVNSVSDLTQHEIHPRSFSMTSTSITEGPSLVLKNVNKFRRSGQSEVIALSGAPGLGKSSLIQSIQPEARTRGYFCSGKFDQLKKTPFESTLKVMSSLFQQIFSELDLDSPFHNSLRAFIQPVWGILYTMLGLPEWLCDPQGPSRYHPIRPPLPTTRPRRVSSPPSPLASERNSTKSTASLRSFNDAVRGSSQTNIKNPRFMAVFLNTLRFISSQKLLVFSFDDVQFADEESLDLLLNVIQAKIPMILIFTFRDRASLPPKAALLLADEIATVTEIELPPWSEDQIGEFVSKCFNRSQEYLFPLVAVISEKTGGNPFFVREMLETAYRKDCIWFSWRSSEWVYNLDKVFAEFESPSYGAQMNNDFILTRLLELPESSRQLLAWATLLGNTFSFALVKILMQGGEVIAKDQQADSPPSKASMVRHSSHDVVRGLSAAISSFIIQPGEDDDHFRFCHNRYQQAAASLPECKNHEEMHYAISVTMIRHHEGKGDVFDLASHICASADLIKKRVTIRAPYRDVLYEAADKATETGGKSTTLKYCTSALKLLQRHPWDESTDDVQYQETLTLFTRTADCYWHEGFIEPALALLHTLLRKAHEPTDKVLAYIIQSRIFIRRGDSNSAFRVLKRCMAELGFDEPPTTWEDCDKRFKGLHQRLSGASASDLLRRPVNTDPTLSACTRCLCELMASAYFCDPLLFYQFALLEIEINLDHGITAEAGLAYVHFAAIAIGRFDLVSLGCKVGDIAKSFFEMPIANAYVIGRGVALHCMLIGCFQNPISALVPILDQALEKSLSANDDFFSLMTIGTIAAARLWSSQDVAEVESYCSWGPEEIINWQDDVTGGVIVIAVRQVCRLLRGRTNASLPSTLLSDRQHHTSTYLSYVCERSSNPDRSKAVYLSFNVMALCLFGYHAEANELGVELTKTTAAFWSIRFTASKAFYLSISALAVVRENPNQAEQQAVIDVVRKRQERMVTWGQVVNVNFAGWSSMLMGLLYEIDGHYGKALECFESALDHAEVHSFVLDQAFMSELYAEFMIRRGANRPARAMLHEAIAKYQTISAFGKAKLLQEKHEWILRGTTSLNKSDMGCQTTDDLDANPVNSVVDFSTSDYLSPGRVTHAHHEGIRDRNAANTPTHDALGLDMIDVTGLLQSSQVMSSELNVERLLSKMTKIILESTGAEITTIAIEDEEHGFVIPAVRDSSGREWDGDEGVDPVREAERKVARTIIANCMRFKEPLLIPNVLENDRFSNVPEVYRYAKSGRAICAMPLSHSHGDEHVFGAVYIEAPPHSFTERNMTVLRLLVNPVSISITNAMLFKRVEKASASNAVMVESQKHALAQAREAQQKAKMSEAEALRSMRLKEEAVRAKSMFLANVSHELRTPLNGVIGMSELLKGSRLNSEQEGYADSIRVCADTLLTVINDILDFSKLEAGKMQMFSVPLSLTETIAEVVRALSYSNTMKPLKTIMQLELDKDLLVMGDPVRLHQILMNLLSNSYKFTSQGSVTVRAVVDEETDREVVVTCSVSDTGVGISPEQKKKLFKPFSQADSSTARTYGGTGLGLSICKAIIENVMKGSIWLDSELGKGTTVSFTLRFPKVPRSNAKTQEPSRNAQKADPMAVFSPESEEMPHSPARTAIDISQIPRDQIRICIAEDNPINQKIAISFVQKLGYKCEAFGDGRQAVDALSAASTAGRPFHVVLMDVQMPVLDGYDASREVRNHSDPTVRDVIIIAMTASAIRGDREKCLEAGMNNYLAKPVRQQVLKQMLDGYLGQGETPPSQSSSSTTAAAAAGDGNGKSTEKTLRGSTGEG